LTVGDFNEHAAAKHSLYEEFINEGSMGGMGQRRSQQKGTEAS